MKRYPCLNSVFFLFLLAAFFLPGVALANTVIRQGDPVQVHYVCRLKNGEIAAATLDESKLGAVAVRADVFQPVQKDAPLSLQAGIKPKVQNESGAHDFADEIATQISSALVGLPFDESQSIKISAGRAPYRPQATITLPRVRRRPMELRLLPEEYVNRIGKAAEVGAVFTLDPNFPGTVVAVTGDEILIRFAAPPDKKLETPFGPATVREDGNQYLIDIELQQGDVVRSGPMLGRVVAADARSFTVDYGNPLAGQDLVCEVSILPSTDYQSVNAVNDAADQGSQFHHR